MEVKDIIIKIRNILKNLKWVRRQIFSSKTKKKDNFGIIGLIGGRNEF